MIIRDDEIISPPIDLAAFRERKKSKAAEGERGLWRIRLEGEEDAAVIVENDEIELRWEPGSARKFGEWMLNHVNYYRRKRYRAEKAAKVERARELVLRCRTAAREGVNFDALWDELDQIARDVSLSSLPTPDAGWISRQRKRRMES